MKHIYRLMTGLMLCVLLSPMVHGVRSYSDSVDSPDELSIVVNDYENAFLDGETEQTVIVRTDGSRPDFRLLHPEYTVQGPEDTYVVCFSDEAGAQEGIEALNDTAGVLYAEPNVMVYAQMDGETTVSHSWGTEFMHLPGMVEQLQQKESEPVTVAVVDSGIAQEHELFDGRIANGVSFISEPFYEDDYGHGTSVAGVAADCTQGLPVNFLIVKVLDEVGRGSLLNAANGIRYAAEQGAAVINVSFVSTTCSLYLHDAVNYALELGSLPVIAAGNYTLNLDKYDCCPSHMTEPIVVSGCDSNGDRYKKSCYGSMVDLTAPAVAVDCAYRSGGYAAQTGTSFAAPHVSAVAAMYKLYDPEADPMRLEALLLRNVRDLGDLGFDTYFGWGVPDLTDVDIRNAAVTAVQIETPPSKTEYNYNEAFDPVGLTVRVSYADGTQSLRSQGLAVTGTEKLKRGDNVITVSYQGHSDTFIVHVQMRWWQWIIKILLFGWIWY